MKLTTITRVCVDGVLRGTDEDRRLMNTSSADWESL